MRTGDDEDAPAARSAGELALELGRRVECVVAVRYSRSREHAIRCERLRQIEGGVARVTFDLRLAAFFSSAPDAIVDDLARWLLHGRRSRGAHTRLMAWIDARWAAQAPRTIPAWARRTAGEHHDLEQLFAELRSARGGQALARLDPVPTIGWGRWPTRAPKRGLQLGSYEHERAWVRIHPVLDTQDVPDWFVRFVLFHECLHALVAQNRWDGGAHHGPIFRRLEAAHPDTARADAWQTENTSALVRRVRARFARR
ncbi:hypothetical protein Pla163_09620 [Planctomycetes bacterium Pla163]|uniref:SprT-like family protein n=1 Tax=Rohdeia mirabilis TaxID=2528008 RepID=A0A518CXA8_9BACT|nr:hypothetical protein Pla163_09620 [Planctomycetes bacterium Pla163]